jgi:MFS family permease
MNTTVSVVNLSIAFGSLSVAITPLWWSYLAELYGRRLVYISSFLLLGLFSILSAISPNIGMFIAMRLLGSASSASLQAVSAGTISDLFEAKERGKAMGAFMLGPMLGPMFAPIIGGALTMNWSWRSTQWFMVIYGWAVFVVMVFFMPETATNLEENRRQNRNDATSPAKKVGYFLLKPMEAAKLLQYPPILITVYYTSIVFATYYLICVSIEDTFALPPYSWSSVIVGVAYIPGGLGLLCGAIVGGRWQDYIMARTAKKEGRYDDKGELILHPVDRLGENCLFAGILFPGALLWWGWAADKHTFWLVPVRSFLFIALLPLPPSSD